MLKKTQGSADVDASRILVKGPEFLRRQIERDGTKGRVSAVERLAATKPHYVRSPQVPQEPVINTGSGQTQKSFRENISVGDEPTRPDSVVRRVSSKKRDSILLYRQKCELLRGSPAGCRRITPNPLISVKDQTNAKAQSDAKVCYKVATKLPPTPRGPDAPPGAHLRVTDAREREGRRGVVRSSSDISSRYSKNFADFDAFFKYCGLDGDIIDSLGTENFSARSDDLRIRSVSVATSDDASSESSGHSDGLQEDEMPESVHRGTSVVERNARVIKWLYSCRNASEAGKTLRHLD